MPVKNKKWNITIVLIVILVIIIVCIFVIVFNPTKIQINKNEYKSGHSNQSKIPNIIWTFWEGEPNKFVDKCILSWKNYNPEYKINIITKENYRDYINIDLSKIKHTNDSLARYSDYIRLCILSKYGGIWIDASIICHSPFTWIHGIQKKTDCDMVGYYIDGFTTEEYLSFSPVIENWFFACVPESKFVSEWKDELLRTGKFNQIDDYIEDVVNNNNINLQKIDAPNYLVMHVAGQKILQINKDAYNIVLFSATTSAFKYLIDTNWNTVYAVLLLTNRETAKQYYKYPIVKLRGPERIAVEYFKENMDNMFSHLQQK